MSSHDTSREIHIQRDWKKSVALVALSAALIAVFLLGTQIELDDPDDWEFYITSWTLLPVFCGLFVFALYRLLVPQGAPVRLSPEAFHDARAGKNPIPWAEVRNVARHGSWIFLTMRLAYARKYPFTLSQRLLKSTRKRAGPSHVMIADWCLAAEQRELRELIEAYWGQYGPE